MGGYDEREQTLNQLLTEMDGFDTRKGVQAVKHRDGEARLGRDGVVAAMARGIGAARHGVFDVHKQSVALVRCQYFGFKLVARHGTVN